MAMSRFKPRRSSAGSRTWRNCSRPRTGTRVCSRLSNAARQGSLVAENDRRSMSTGSETHMIILPGGGYSTHVSHEAEPIAEWLEALGVRASVFRYPLHARHPAPLQALRGEIRRRREGGADCIGIIGFSAGGHLA